MLGQKVQTDVVAQKDEIISNLLAENMRLQKLVSHEGWYS